MKFMQFILTAVVLTGIATLSDEAKAQNPIVGGSEHTDVIYDPFADHTYVKRERVSVRESAFDPGRMYVDPGSAKYVDRYFRDNNGQTVHEYGWTWTSYGRPHGKLTRRRVTHYPPRRPGCQPGGGPGGVTIDDSETIVYDAGGNRPPRTGRPPRRNPRRNPRQGGGVSVDDRETVIYSVDPNRNKSKNNNRNNRRNNNQRQTRKNNNRRPVTFGMFR